MVATDVAKCRLARERAERAREMLRSCRLCPRACGVDRTAGEVGFCGLAEDARCFREVLHYGEEGELVPSHQVYFAGCNLRCEWCAVGEWNASPEDAAKADPVALGECIERRLAEGARTLNLLGGEPTVSLFGILRVLSEAPEAARVVWNSNMYFSDEAARLLDGVVDVYLADFKCANDACAERLLGARDYVAIVSENLRFARRSADLIVRHLALPGHRDCCAEPALRWLKENMPEVKVSLRRDYLPPARAREAPARTLDDGEYRAAFDFAKALGLNLIE